MVAAAAAAAAADALPAKCNENACLPRWHQTLHRTMPLTQDCPASCYGLVQTVLCVLAVYVTPSLDVIVGLDQQICYCTFAAPAAAG